MLSAGRRFVFSSSTSVVNLPLCDTQRLLCSLMFHAEYQARYTDACLILISYSLIHYFSWSCNRMEVPCPICVDNGRRDLALPFLAIVLSYFDSVKAPNKLSLSPEKVPRMYLVHSFTCRPLPRNPAQFIAPPNT